MRKLLIPLLAAFALPTAVNAEISDKVHNRCKDAKDYVGCVKAQSINQSGLGKIGNACPAGFAYVGAGYCQKVWCQDAFRHDRKLGGKGWTCFAKKGGNPFANSLTFRGSAVLANTDQRCPLEEPEVGRNNSCQNGVPEEQIKSSKPPIGMFDLQE